MKENAIDRFCIKLCVGFVLALFVFVAGYHSGRSELGKQVRIDTLHIRDTVRQSFPVLVASEPVMVAQPVDTAAILREHFTLNVFRDTLRVKDFGIVTVTDTVFQNRIGGREFTYDLSIPTCTSMRRAKFDIGVGAFAQRDAYGLQASLKVKHLLLSGGYDFKNQSPHVGVLYMFGK